MTLIISYINTSELFHDLKAMGRDNFSYDGAKALMEYLDEDSEQIEYDPIAFCCEFAEYSYLEFEQLASEYGHAPNPSEFEDEDDFNNAVIEWFNDQTLVIEFDEGVIIQSF